MSKIIEIKSISHESTFVYKKVDKLTLKSRDEAYMSHTIL